MRVIKIVLLVTFLIPLVFLLPLYSRQVATSPEKDLLDMTLEELLNVRVAVASKTKEAILKASGTVYTLTEEDFKNYGWRTVGEALEALPGMDLSMNYRYLDGGHRGFGSDFSETILLVDGREIQKYRNGRASQPLMIYPLEHVERIEVLQGPASTLYGSHALQGVISIITRTANAERAGSRVAGSFLYGEARSQQLAIEAFKETGDFYIGISAHRFYSDRDWGDVAEYYANPANIRQDDEGSCDKMLNTDPNDFNNREKDKSIHLHLEYKGLYGGFHYLENDNLHTPGNGGFSGAFRAGIMERIFYLGFRHRFNDNINAFIEIERLFQRDEYANFHLAGSGANPGLTEVVPFDETDRLNNYRFDDSQRWDTEIWKLKGKVDAGIGGHNLLSIGFDMWSGNYFYANGVNTFYALNSDSLDWPNTKNKKYSLFLQDRLMLFNEGLKILAGIRFNKEDYVDDSLTPRVSIVGEPIEGTVIKATYSEGFRALAFGQFGQSVGNVAPTKMNMLELNYSQYYKSGKWEIMNSFSWYTMEQIGVLTRQKTPGLVGIIWENTGEKRRCNGIENFLRVRHNLFSGFFSVYRVFPATLNIAESGEEYLADIPKYKVKLGLTVHVTKHLDLSLFVNHWGKTRWEVDNYDPAGCTILPGKTLHTQAAFTTLNVNVRLVELELKEAGGLEFDITAVVENVTNRKYTHHLRPWVAMGHMQPPRRFQVKLNFRL